MPVFRIRHLREPTDAQVISGKYRKRVVKWRGLDIAIENEAGSIRRGVDRGGHAWQTRMHYAYGYAKRSEGVDGDEVDIYLGPSLDAPTVYIVHQRKYGDWAAYDEDKAMVGFDGEESARAAYLSCYNDARFLGPITAMPADEFVRKVRATKGAPAMIKAILFFKSNVAAYIRGGSIVRAHATRRVARVDHSQGDLFAAAPAKPEPEPERFESVHRDAAGRDPAGNLECGTCHHPHEGDHCSNPGCTANPSVSEETKARWTAEAARRKADDVDRERVRDIRNSAMGYKAPAKPKVVFASKPTPEALPEGHTRAHYVTVVREAGTPAQKVGWLAGPFGSKAEATSHVEPARLKAREHDPFTDFDAFGTSSRVGESHPPGVLNAHLGIGGSAGRINSDANPVDAASVSPDKESSLTGNRARGDGNPHMTNWEDMSEAEKDSANEFAYARAADRLRQTLARNPGLDVDDARGLAYAEIDADIAEDRRTIARSKRARATKADIRFAANCLARIQDYSLEQGFIFDVEV